MENYLPQRRGLCVSRVGLKHVRLHVQYAQIANALTVTTMIIVALKRFDFTIVLPLALLLGPLAPQLPLHLVEQVVERMILLIRLGVAGQAGDVKPDPQAVADEPVAQCPG